MFRGASLMATFSTTHDWAMSAFFECGLATRPRRTGQKFLNRLGSTWDRADAHSWDRIKRFLGGGPERIVVAAWRSAGEYFFDPLGQPPLTTAWRKTGCLESLDVTTNASPHRRAGLPMRIFCIWKRPIF